MRFTLKKKNFLPQTSIVDVLLEAIDELLITVPESEKRQRVTSALLPFNDSIVPSALSLSEVNARLREAGLEEDRLLAADLLLDAAYDLDLNYASDVITNHIDRYIEAR